MSSTCCERDSICDYIVHVDPRTPLQRALQRAGIVLLILLFGIAAPAVAITTCLGLPVIPPHADVAVAFVLLGLVAIAATVRLALWIRERCRSSSISRTMAGSGESQPCEWRPLSCSTELESLEEEPVVVAG